MGAEAQASATSIVVEDAKVFFTGQKIQNVTKSDDNSSKGYAVTAVDERTNTLTVAPGTYFVYDTRLNNLNNDQEDFGGMMTEIHITAP